MRTPSETAGQPEETPDGGELGDQPTERPGEERRGPPSTRVGHRRQLRRRRPGRPGRRRADRSGRQSRKAKQAAGQPVAGDAGNRGAGGPALSHLDSTEHDHRVRRRATSDDDAAGDRGGDGTGQGVRCTPTTNVGPSGQPGGGEAGNRSVDGPGGRGGGRRCDRRAGWGNPAAARRAGNRRTRRGPTDVRLHRRSTSRSGQPGRRPTGRANAGPLDLIHRGAPHHVPVCQGAHREPATDTVPRAACRCDAAHLRSPPPAPGGRPTQTRGPRVRSPGTPPTVLAWTPLPAPRTRA